MDLKALYHEALLDHGQRPRNRRRLPAATHRAEGYNPLCGDRVGIELCVRDGLIREVAFEGAGCAIATASASLLTQVIQGRTPAEALALVEAFRHAMVERGEIPVEDLNPLAGVREFPMRVKCATLPWHALRLALQEERDGLTNGDPYA